MPLATLTPAQSRFVEAARRATLATRSPSGRPRPMPVCFAMVGALGGAPRLYVPIDEKPKRSTESRRLARVRDIEARPDVAVLVDRWDEDWSRLAWVRLEGTANVLWPSHGSDRRPGEAAESNAGDARVVEEPGGADERRTAIGLLRARYPQYADHDLESRPLIRVVVTRIVEWGAVDGS